MAYFNFPRRRCRSSCRHRLCCRPSSSRRRRCRRRHRRRQRRRQLSTAVAVAVDVAVAFAFAIVLLVVHVAVARKLKGMQFVQDREMQLKVIVCR